MRYDDQHKQKTRERVLLQAAAAIRSEGPHRVAVAGVMAKAGLTHGGFYAHFASKDDLVAAAIEEMFNDVAKKFGEVTASLGAADALAAYIDFYLSRSHRDAIGAGCPITALAADLPRLKGAGQETYAAGVERLRLRLADLLASLGRQDLETLSSSVVAELVGALSLARAIGSGPASDQVLAASRAALKQRLGLETRK